MKQEEVHKVITKYHDAEKIRLLMEYGEKIVIPVNNTITINVEQEKIHVLYNSTESEDGLILKQYNCKDIEVIQAQY